jgi:hypothetical protein
MKSNSQLIQTTVEDVRLANGHNSHQTVPELNVLLGQWQIATVSAEEQD